MKRTKKRIIVFFIGFFVILLMQEVGLRIVGDIHCNSRK